MYKNESDFLNALERGDRKALKAFYDRLSLQNEDSDFYKEIDEIVTRKNREELTEFINRKSGVDYNSFLKTAPVNILLIFFLMAMLFSACNKSSFSQESETKITQTESNLLNAESTDYNEDESSSSDSTDIEKLRGKVYIYIVKAQLPTGEKRRLKAVLKKASRQTIVDNKSDLSKLFKENDPEKIAQLLEEMILFQAANETSPINPNIHVKYKGVDFSENSDSLNKLPKPVPAYKGVDFS
ncbi:MAG: hypothetical protein JXA60_12465 [Candidatus Coatesbacteria bacterium]|nr:hypothetical protein [Candidatus Coatesbacteria bacterium]